MVRKRRKPWTISWESRRRISREAPFRKTRSTKESPRWLIIVPKSEVSFRVAK